VDLFDTPVSPGTSPPAPLADRMRPRSLDEVVGQQHLIGPGKVLRRALEEGRLHSMILWGPPGTGKTTLAFLMAQVAGARFVPFSAVLAGVKEIRQVVAEAEADRARGGKRTILFVDEIHRFNKGQQDAFLPHVEKGTLILIGATTENPSFEVNAALLSRCRVYSLQPLSEDDIVSILERALADSERGLGAAGATAEPDAFRLIARLSDGDARGALNILDLTVTLHAGAVTEAAIREAVQKKALLYDKSGEEHYNLISALHKSLRDSDPDGALYWLGRMLEAGEDALYIARRLVRFASEDIGNADPQALRLALDVLSRSRPQVQCRLRRVESGAPGHSGQTGRAGPSASPQCPDGTHGQSGLWQGLPVRPRRPRRPGLPGAPARCPARPRLLPAGRPRAREGSRGAARRLEEVAGGAGQAVSDRGTDDKEFTLRARPV